MRVPLAKAVRDSVRYGYAVGRVRALEARVFRDATYERLVDAPTFAEQKRILSDTAYGQHLEAAESADDVERALEAAQQEVYGLLKEFGLPAPFERFFRLRHDYGNLRARLKGEVLGTPIEQDLSRLGSVPLEVLAGPVQELPEDLKRVAQEALAAAARLGSSEQEFGGGVVERRASPDVLTAVDRVVERAMYAQLSLVAREARSEYLREHVRLSVDLANAKMALRSKRRELPLAEVEEAFLEGGRITLARMRDAYGLPLEELAERLASDRALRGVSAEELTQVARMDVAIDALAVRMMRQGRAVPLGAEPVVAYVLAREAEIRQLRVVLIGKIAGLSADDLRSRLRGVYLGRG